MKTKIIECILMKCGLHITQGRLTLDFQSYGSNVKVMTKCVLARKFNALLLLLTLFDVIKNMQAKNVKFT